METVGSLKIVFHFPDFSYTPLLNPLVWGIKTHAHYFKQSFIDILTHGADDAMKSMKNGARHR